MGSLIRISTAVNKEILYFIVNNIDKWETAKYLHVLRDTNASDFIHMHGR